VGLVSFGAGWALRAARRSRRSSSGKALSDHFSEQYDSDLEVRFERLSRYRSVLFHPEIVTTSKAKFWFENAVPQFASLAKVGSIATLVGGLVVMLYLAVSIESFYELFVPYSSLGSAALATALLLGIPGISQIFFGQFLAPAIMFWRINQSFRSEGWDTRLLLTEVRQMHREAKRP